MSSLDQEGGFPLRVGRETRTPDNDLEGRCVTTTPYLHGTEAGA